MRVAIVTTSWPRFPGDPSGHFVEAEARALTRCGDGASALGAARSTPDVVVIAADGGAFGWPGFAARVRESPLRLAGAAAWVARARREVARGGFDRVVAHWAVPSAWPIAAGGGEGPALEVVSHGGDVRLLTGLPALLGARIVRRIASRADRWRFVSEALARALLENVPHDVARLVERIAVVAPCAIDVTPPRAEAIDAKRARIGAPFAVSVGRLIATKRVDAAIAWAAARQLPLVVVGDGPERAALERQARSAGARVTFVGRTTRDEALAWIAASAELVHASCAEGLSTVVREAEMLGVAVASI